ncbi:dTDP-4-dehydrorhamnose 3,5-epimerase [Paenibacillus pinistramenti]|uniref:dTDP-4-dehydrorhamnose 3,5-epimerase n=1 Tax=Paenibacillus pinistramenti TaxID=1768003 RepID=UPI001109AD95|nr:dTDP-4-dehydrorhamnose 3,5-epimerase [Paenibacillus pinistramenti]
MIIKPCRLQGIYEITLSPKADHRGHFSRVFDQQIFKQNGLSWDWVQENRSLSVKKGTIRGLHFQQGPYAETKLIRVSRGAIYDVFVDLRPDSPAFGTWDSILLTEDNNKMVYISKGFAHGFCTLEPNCEVLYKVDQYYSPEHEGGVIWNDPDLRITWPILKPVISDRDKLLPPLEDYKRQLGI